jgi:hypothetical protein
VKASTKLSEVLSLVCIPVAGHPGHWEVESRTEPGNTHRVVLGGPEGMVNCDCANWLFQAESKLRKGEKPFQVSTMCVHIAAAIFKQQARRLMERKI